MKKRRVDPIFIAATCGLIGLGIGFMGRSGSLNASDDAATSFHKRYYDSGVWLDKTFWLGAPTLKCPFDMWVYQEILYETKPDVLIETGTYKGGSAYFFASIFDLMKHGRVVTVDIEDYPNKPKHDRISYLLGSSTSDGVLRAVKSSISPGDRVMVVLDSDHSKKNVLNELRLYGVLVTPGNYLVVEDTNVNGHPVEPSFGPGPMEALEEFLKENSSFRSDSSREKFGLTFYPRGFLKKVSS